MGERAAGPETQESGTQARQRVHGLWFLYLFIKSSQGRYPCLRLGYRATSSDCCFSQVGDGAGALVQHSFSQGCVRLPFRRTRINSPPTRLVGTENSRGDNC